MDLNMLDVSNSIKTRKRDKKNINDSCQELKNIAYRTMLLNGTNIKSTTNDTDSIYISEFLEKETNNKNQETWTKLDKTRKLKILLDYGESLHKEHNLTSLQKTKLMDYLKICLERKLFNKSKDVVYNNLLFKIEKIPTLIFNDENKTFIMKKNDKHISTIKSLAPKKNNKTIKI